MARPRQTPLSRSEKILMTYNEVKGRIEDIKMLLSDEEIGLKSKDNMEPAGRVSARSVSRPVEHEGIKRAELIDVLVSKELFINDIDFYLSCLDERERHILRHVIIDGNRMATICRGLGITDGQGAVAKKSGLRKFEMYIDNIDPEYIAAAHTSP